MKFKHLHAENIRSYPVLDIDFSDGVTVISGVNGSGKSSILEACFMGIFGGEVLRGTTLQISDMIRKGSAKAQIVLDFEHAGDEYKIEQHYKVSKTSAHNSKSVLWKNGEVLAELSKNTYEAVQQLLNMDEKNFQNCAYIRQGDIDALINAKPKDRQQMIDDLLRLGKLEEYRERAHNSKTAVSRILRSEAEKKDELQEKIKDLRSKDLHGELHRRQEVVEKIDRAVSLRNEEKEKLSSELALLEVRLKEAEKASEELEALARESSEWEKKYIDETQRRENLLQEITQTEKKISDLTLSSHSLRDEINGFPSPAGASPLSFQIGEGGADIDAALLKARAAEKEALARKHKVSGEWDILRVKKEAPEKGIRQKENEISELQKMLEALAVLNDEQSFKIRTANDTVKNGFAAAESRKAAFLNRFDALFAELEKGSEEEFPHEIDENQKDEKCISGVCDISFYSNVMKIGELPLPSDEPSWKSLISDLENLKEYMSGCLFNEDGKLAEEEKKKAALTGELEEKERSIAEIEREMRRLDAQKEETALELKNETAAFDAKKRRIADYTVLLDLHASKRAEKLLDIAVLKDIVPPSRYHLGDITTDDIRAASVFLSTQNEEIISEAAGLKSADTEIQKSVLEKETLLKAGKCPTCGQEIEAGSHLGHEMKNEAQRRSDIAARLQTLEALKKEGDRQLVLLKEISDIDEIVDKIKAEINTFRAEESGKSDLIDKYRKDLEEAESQKEALNVRKLEYDIFCRTGRKDLEKIDQRAAALKARSADHREQLQLLSEAEKEFSDAGHSILFSYKTLESEEKSHRECQKRAEEAVKQKEAAEHQIRELQSELDHISAEEIRAASDRNAADQALAAIADVCRKIEFLSGCRNEKEQLKAVLGGLKTTLEEQEKNIETCKSRLAEKKREIQKRAEIVRTAKEGSGLSFPEQKQRLADQIRTFTEEVKQREAQKNAVLEEIGQFRKEISLLADYEKDAERQRNKLLYLSHVAEDVTVLEQMYLRIRSEMRAKNIEALDRLLNEMFDFIYANNAYSHLELDSDYNLKVHEKDGSVLEPKQLSGGERAIFNLALRCAIYRLLSLGFGERGAGKTSLPPLIFDEPTVFLDSGHVRQLIQLIEHMRDDGAGQIIVVSHDDSLIDSADVNFKVEKDTLTNASFIH